MTVYIAREICVSDSVLASVSCVRGSVQYEDELCQ